MHTDPSGAALEALTCAKVKVTPGCKKMCEFCMGGGRLRVLGKPLHTVSCQNAIICGTARSDNRL